MRSDLVYGDGQAVPCMASVHGWCVDGDGQAVPCMASVHGWCMASLHGIVTVGVWGLA